MRCEPDAVEIRVVGCLVEKQRTTPDAYPLSLNALRLACNQSTNRDPVVDYDEATVCDALRRLALRGWTRLASGAGIAGAQVPPPAARGARRRRRRAGVLAVLMLRGAQTPGELKRADRADARLRRPRRRRGGDRAPDRARLVVRHPRRPGQKEDRYEQVLGGEGAAEAEVARRASRDADDEEFVRRRGGPDPGRAADEVERLDRLETELLDLSGEIARLREALGD